MKGCFMCKKGGRLNCVYRKEQIDKINSEVEMCKDIIDEVNIEKHRNFLKKN